MPLALTPLKFPSVVKKNTHFPSSLTIQQFNTKGKGLIALANKLMEQQQKETVDITISIPRKILPLVSALYSISAGECPNVDNIVLKKTKCTLNQLQTAHRILEQIELALATTL